MKVELETSAILIEIDNADGEAGERSATIYTAINVLPRQYPARRADPSANHGELANIRSGALDLGEAYCVEAEIRTPTHQVAGR